MFVSQHVALLLALGVGVVVAVITIVARRLHVVGDLLLKAFAQTRPIVFRNGFGVVMTLIAAMKGWNCYCKRIVWKRISR